jgi:transposase-like protein
MTPDIPEKLDGLTPHQLIDEIRQIAEQYGREVKTARRTWPESLRLRVLALGNLGVPKQRISKLCGIPAATVFFWCKGLPQRRSRPTSDVAATTALAPRFVRLPEIGTPKLTPTVGMGVSQPKTDPESAHANLSLCLPGGIEIRGLSVSQALELYRGIHSA